MTAIEIFCCLIIVYFSPNYPTSSPGALLFYNVIVLDQRNMMAFAMNPLLVLEATGGQEKIIQGG